MLDNEKLRAFIFTEYTSAVSIKTVLCFFGMMILPCVTAAFFGDGVFIIIISALILLAFAVLCVSVNKKHGMKNGYNFLVLGTGGCFTSLLYLICSIHINYAVTHSFNNAAAMIVVYFIGIVIFSLLTIRMINRFHKPNRKQYVTPIAASLAGPIVLSLRSVIIAAGRQITVVILSVLCYFISVALLFSIAVLMKYFILKFNHLLGGDRHDE